ncbi:alpha-2-macroglobulin-like isoform X1 [Seriola dumerili]|uniref:alpha-2-macroglobulin-like isoform X1 n=1 Tax=Seriola dumerili TaxID=41447 RepID=UPI000BBEEDAA|nr:alpha-2-macroglobulin-like isoform X1 [Seriola dumerili]
MGFSGLQIRTWKLFVCLSWICVVGTMAKPQYMVAVPAVLEAGAETKFCVSLLQPNETLVMTVTLISQEKNTTLLKQASSEEFHTCTHFKAPLVQNKEVQKFEVEVRGDTFYSKEIKKVMIKVYQPMTFVQTDKPIYLPGQTVHFRVITLDTRLRPVGQLYNVIEIKDSNDNRIGQWLNENSNSKILQLSYSLNSEAREGNYHISVSVDGRKTSHSFKVEKYVLPKFAMKINTPDEVSIGQEEFKAEVCLKYTYGQPVPGSVEVKVCRTHTYQTDYEDPCYRETKQTDKTGCATFTFSPYMLQGTFYLYTKVEEEGTGISFSQTKNIGFSYKVGTLSFIDTPKIYQEGSNVEGKVKAVHYNNTPIPDMVVYLFEGKNKHSARLLQNLTTDSDGIAAFSFNTSNHKGDVNLHVRSQLESRSPIRTPFYEDGHHKVSLAKLSTPDAKTISSLEVRKKDEPLPCDREETISIRYTVVGEKQASVDVMYLVLSRGAIVMQGFKKIEVRDNSVTEGKVSFQLEVSPEVAPVIQVIAYAILPSETVIANSTDFKTEKCFSHKVSLDFSPSSAVPGEETTMQVTAQPDSLCGVSAVDQSVLIKEPGKTLNADKILDLLPVKEVSQVPSEVREQIECLMWGRRYFNPRYAEKDDAFSVFRRVGLKMATNLIEMPVCVMPEILRKYSGPLFQTPSFRFRFTSTSNHRMRVVNSPVSIVEIKSVVEAPPIQTVRTFFPETWIWDLVDVGETGTKDVSFTVPDTITTWETEAFCLSPQGFGLAPRKELTVFQPFFLELTLPYSIIRGEHFELKATTFNYLSSCIMVTVTPAPSLDYTLTPHSSDQYTSCLCGSERKTLSWTMVPSSLGVVNVTVSAEAVASQASCDNEIVTVPDRGRIDVVTRSLIVKAEGTEMTKTHNWLLCPKGEALTEEIDLQLPENVIAGSARASISVLGDILGRALKNLDGLLQMPYGCGEQNMALLAPNIYILQYLKNTQQLTPAILEKATNFLTSGYQRQLNYKHNDGAYSTFGRGTRNTWLTAFVMRCFGKAQSFIYIDPAKIQQSKTWLLSKQQGSGCFQKSGKLFNNRMKGGVSDEVTLSAYITAALLEMSVDVEDDVVKKSLSCLKESIGDLSNTYTTALLAYVFTLAGDTETRDHLLQHLDTVAVKQGSLLHWSQTATDTSASLSVEISSYVMLAKLSASPTPEDLGYTSSIVRWLTGQQNHYGGFSSTQDTVVALQALALYSTLTFSPEGSSTVTVQSASGQLTIDVNQNNKLLYQEKTLPDVTGKYSLEVKGTACASMQVSLHYNIPTPTDGTTLTVRVKPTSCISTSLKPRFTLEVTSRYSGKETTPNMVILDIKMLSGFVPDPESLKRVSYQRNFELSRN